MDRIHVTVRARPLSAEDAQSSPWRISGNAVALTTQPSTRFDFDEIFSEECRTADVYGARTKHIVDSAVQGFNGTVFAYGQTNSGKTYTMRGSANEPGIIPLAVHDLFRSIQEHMDREFLVRMSYMEIYNEEINDLLVPEHRKLQIHENYERGIYVAGLREEIVTYPEQVLDFVSFGESHRHIGETNMNVYSSRSHTIFRMVIESREKADETEAGDSCDAVRVSVLNLVDLAGSERAAKTGAEGVRLKEGSHINKSLMTLGTVIKKLSEGVKGQGGHVPYRDSKLTRILQPALGGNANTAIICNITLAQIHADETKSSLQFASRALRVTNCAEVNEILTDAALLKRQRKEIEELRAKLKNSQSEHWDEDVLNLRNTLLQSELEKERIALELEEERKAKEHREKRLLQQAKKIENLSSLVLNSDRDDRVVVSSKNKRRQTWCARPLSRQLDVEVPELEQGSARSCGERDMGMPPSFEELMQESPASYSEPAHGCSSSDLWNEDISLPDSHALFNVTSRRKPSIKKKLVQEQLRSLVPESPQDPNEWKDAMLCQEITNPNGLSARESEAILVIKQLQDQVNLLESEKSLIQNNLDDVLELATQQKASFSEKYEELQRNALVAQEQAKTADEKLSALATIEKSKQELAYSFLSKVSMETQGIAVQMDQMTHSVDGAISFIEELFQNHSVIAENVTELKELAYGHITQSSYVIRDHEKMSKKLMEKIGRLELEKDCILQNDMEKDSILSELLTLRKEVSTLSSSSLMKEKESIRKELDRAKIKLRETENKLKNYIQEKIKLEGEKAEAHKEIKKLQNQRTLLERDLRKHDSLTVDKRHELNVKPEELAGFFDQAAQMQEEYQRLEIHASDMEAEIASLQETLITSSVEKEEALSKVELMMLEHEDLENRFTSTESKMNSLSDEIAVLNKKLDASESSRRKLEASLSSLSGEKEDLGMQLTDVLLEMESERSMWISKEKAYLEAKQQLDICNDENSKLSEDLIKARQELVQCRELLKTLEGKMILSVEDDLNEKKCGRESCKESELVDKGRNIDNAADENELHKQLLIISEERDSLLSKMEQMSLAISELEVLKEVSNNKLIQAKANMDELSCQISTMEVKMKHDASTFNKEKTKLRMQIRWLQPELDANRGRLKEAVEERRLMDKKYQEATAKLKKELKETCQKVLKLREELKKSQGTSNGSSNVSSTQLT
ncbi:kinesin-like protein KIN-7I [Lolium rigidum]|uniref:kinesin-like protein KIN-7I n=1 Tax=Lolium rigidum TaxID=89674 RepID=UPI001F5CB44A|nr:kinesin-like protein KIN-7I [Lolium rigidum]